MLLKIRIRPSRQTGTTGSLRMAHRRNLTVMQSSLAFRPDAEAVLERVEELQRQTGLRPDREVPDVASAFCGCPWIFSTAGTGSDLSRTACG
jgi:hypothetical protein